MIQYGVIGKENNLIVGDWENYVYVYVLYDLLFILNMLLLFLQFQVSWRNHTYKNGLLWLRQPHVVDLHLFGPEKRKNHDLIIEMTNERRSMIQRHQLHALRFDWPPPLSINYSKKNQYQQPAIDDYAVMVPGVRGLYHVRLDKVFK